jgi:hypothetical protein
MLHIEFVVSCSLHGHPTHGRAADATKSWGKLSCESHQCLQLHCSHTTTENQTSTMASVYRSLSKKDKKATPAAAENGEDEKPKNRQRLLILSSRGTIDQRRITS